MSALSETDHAQLRRAEQAWLRETAQRLRAAAPARRTTTVRSTHPMTNEKPEQPR